MTPSVVALGSANPAKRNGAELALARAFGRQPPPVVAIDVVSGVRAQPWGDTETRKGADRRARAALSAAAPSGQTAIGLGIEGGVVREDGTLWTFSWAVAVGGDRYGAARSGAFALPPRIAAMVDEGVELGDACDRVFGLVGSKHAGGAVGLVTGGALERPELYAHVVLLALAPLLRPELYGN